MECSLHSANFPCPELQYPVHTLSSSFCKIHFSVTIHTNVGVGFVCGQFQLFPTELYKLKLLLVFATSSAHLILDLITRIVFGR